MKTRVLVLALAAALARAATAHAQLREGTFEINGFAGYLVGGHFGDVPGTPLYQNGYRLDVGDDVNYGGRLGWNFTNTFELELEYARTPTHLEIDPFNSNLPNITFSNFTIQYYMSYMTFNFGRGRSVGFFTIGGGAANFKPATLSGASKTYGTAAIGGGYKYFFNPHFALRLDAKLYSTAVGSRSFYCGYGYYCHGTNWVTNFVPSGGFVVAF